MRQLPKLLCIFQQPALSKMPRHFSHVRAHRSQQYYLELCYLFLRNVMYACIYGSNVFLLQVSLRKMYNIRHLLCH